MIDFLKFNDNISDEMLAAYIDGNATEEEKSLIENSISSDEMLSEVVDVVNGINLFQDEKNDLGFLDNGDDTIEFDFENTFISHPEEKMVAAIQEPLELNVDVPPLDSPDDINIGDESMDDIFNV